MEAANGGRTTGAVLALVIAILGIAKCLKIMKRERTSTVCVAALMMWLIGWAISAIYPVLAAGIQKLPMVAVLLAIMLALLSLSGIILGIVGLAQYDLSRYDQGRKQAIWAIVLCTLLLLGLSAGAISGFNRARNRGIVGDGPARREAVADRNFAITPPAGWMKIDPKALNAPAAIIGFRRFGPEMYSMVLAEELGDGVPTETLTNLVKQNMTSLSEIQEQAEEKVSLNGLDFQRIQTSARLKTINMALYYEHWLVSYRGMFWQVVTWSPVANRAATIKAAREFAEKFEVLDRNRRTTAAGTFEDVDLPALGVKTALAGKGWNRGGGEMTANPTFCVAAERLYEALLVAAVRFDGDVPELEVLNRGLLPLLNFTYPIKAEATEHPFSTSAGEGVEIQTERKVDDTTFAYVLRLIRGENTAFLVVGWAEKEKGDLELVRAAMDAVELKMPTGQSGALTTKDKTARAGVHNQIGLAYVALSNNPASAPWFRGAAELDPANGQYIANLTYVLGTMGREEEALTILEKEYRRFPKAYDLLTQRCTLLANKGEAERAQKDFTDLIDRGLRDEKRLMDWVGVLFNCDRGDLAEQAVVKWNEKLASPNTLALQVDVASRRGDTKRALQLAEEFARKNEANQMLALKLGDMLNEAGEHARAGEVAEKILASKPDESDALQILGWSQMGRKSYSQAKATFEKAAKGRPQDESIAIAIQRASSALGQGQNSEVKQRLEPVPLPKAVAKELEKPSVEGLETDGRPMLVLRRSTGYLVEKGKPHRKTLRRTIKVLNQAGVNLLSNMEYPFDPLSERMFVNRLEVTDADGKVTASGSVDDVFVRDSGGESASNRRVLNVPVPGVHPGCTIDLEITTEERSVGSEFNLARHTFAYRTPCAAEAVYVVGDYRNLATSLQNGSAVRTIKEPGLLAWSLKRIQPEPDEPYATPVEERVPTIVISSRAASWAAVGKQYLEDIAERLTPEPAIHDLAAKLCAGLSSEREKIDALTREVQKTIGYKAIEFGVRARVPNKASDTLRYRYGDCKDHAVLLHQLLKEAGVTSHLALVNSSSRVLPEIPTLDQFDHMVVHVPALGEKWLVDPTLKYSPVTSLPMAAVRDTHVLIADPQGSRLMPYSFEPGLGTADVSINRTLTPSGKDWQVTETVSFAGYYGAAIRGTYDELTPSEQARRVQAALAGDGSAEVKSFQVENMDNLAEPARIKMSYVVRDAIKSAGGKATATLPALWERDYLSMSYLADRKTPFQWRFPFRLKSEVTLEGSPDVSLQPLAKKGGTKGGRWSMEPAPKGAAPTAAFQFEAETGRWEPHDYQDVYGSWTAARRVWDTTIEWAER